AYFLDEDDNPWNVLEWVSTGSTLLDLAISNRRNGGLPAGKIVEFSGLESTGKSLFCGHILANTQKMGGIGVFFDSEAAIDKNYWKAIGVKIPDVLCRNFMTLEELFSEIELIIGITRKKYKDRLLTIFVDSIAQATIEQELESAHGKDGYNTGKSLILGKAMRKIVGLINKQRILLVLTNQLRYNMNAGLYGDKWITPGGKAIAFAASVRIRLASKGKVIKNDQVIGVSTQAHVVKNRLGPGGRFATFEIHYDSGIQDLASWLKFMKEYSIIKGDGRGYTYKTNAGEEIKFNTQKFLELVKTNPELKDEFYRAICDSYIMQYRDPSDAIIEDTKEISEDDFMKEAEKVEE
ncbi:MAG TPA: hypothetical protein PKX15_03580, partial [Bacteroidales bacterium]|nr:hypothetical protein [Bacteroidales bacterium]